MIVMKIYVWIGIEKLEKNLLVRQNKLRFFSSQNIGGNKIFLLSSISKDDLSNVENFLSRRTSYLEKVQRTILQPRLTTARKLKSIFSEQKGDIVSVDARVQISNVTEAEVVTTTVLKVAFQARCTQLYRHTARTTPE